MRHGQRYGDGVASWADFEKAEPRFASQVKRLFDAGSHKTIATLRSDGSPRISGIECRFGGGQLQFGSMPGSRKGEDLHRDPRFALHGPTFHPEPGAEGEWSGEAKIAGLAVPAGPVSDNGVDGEMFSADIREVVVTGLNDDATRLAIQVWTPSRGLSRIERD